MVHTKRFDKLSLQSLLARRTLAKLSVMEAVRVESKVSSWTLNSKSSLPEGSWTCKQKKAY